MQVQGSYAADLFLMHFERKRRHHFWQLCWTDSYNYAVWKQIVRENVPYDTHGTFVSYAIFYHTHEAWNIFGISRQHKIFSKIIGRARRAKPTHSLVVRCMLYWLIDIRNAALAIDMMLQIVKYALIDVASHIVPGGQ